MMQAIMNLFLDSAMLRTSALALALLMLLTAAASVAGALVIEALGYAPCELCLKERIPYYIALPIAGLAVFLALRGQKRALQAAFIALSLIFSASAVFGAYHAGIELGFWRGPTECTGALAQPRDVGGFLAELQRVKVPRCDAPALRIFGLSLAAWNALISAGLALLPAAASILLASNRYPPGRFQVPPGSRAQ
jgi:disulfide bond formation protein DsbB